MLSIPLHQKLLSYLQPVLLERSPSAVSGYLELHLYHNRFQLLTAGALYSDGARYSPARAVARHLSAFLPGTKQVLLLGAGLGSLVQVIRARGCGPHFTLVEKDRSVLRWTRKVLEQAPGRVPSGQSAPEVDGGAEEFLDDAERYMARNQCKYDLIFVDLFAGREVPGFVTTPLFLRQCRHALYPGGHLALNYLEVDAHGWNQVRKTFAEVFPDCHVIRKHDNRILISRPTTD